jgi:hypothetical protein
MNKLPKPRRTGFYKGIDGFTVSDDDGLLKGVRDSIYYWWWRFMRLNPVFWYAREMNFVPSHPKVAEAYRLAGDLNCSSFETWWNTQGQYVFEEEAKPASVKFIDVDNFAGHELYQNSIVVEIPLTITTRKISSDIQKILKSIQYDTDAYSVIEHSTSQLKLKTKKFSLSAIEDEYWVFLYRNIFPRVSDWQIADRLQLAPSNRVRGLDQRAVNAVFARGTGPFAKLQATAGRSLSKARSLQRGVSLGSFPNYSAQDNGLQPFEGEHQQAFEENILKKEVSPWNAFLTQRFQSELLAKIAKVNRIPEKLFEDENFQREIYRFSAGEIDSIPQNFL